MLESEGHYVVDSFGVRLSISHVSQEAQRSSDPTVSHSHPFLIKHLFIITVFFKSCLFVKARKKKKMVPEMITSDVLPSVTDQLG